jgi:hypothetical protein
MNIESKQSKEVHKTSFSEAKQFMKVINLINFRNLNCQVEGRLTAVKTHTVKINLDESFNSTSENGPSSSVELSQPGEENLSSSTDFEDEECDTMESVDEAIPPKMNIHQTKKTNSLRQYKTRP